MKSLVVKGVVPKTIPFCIINSFDEEYSDYLKNTKKNMWRTVEGFSLEFDSYLEDLKESCFVHTDSEDSYDYIKQNFKVIEEY